MMACAETEPWFSEKETCSCGGVHTKSYLLGIRKVISDGDLLGALCPSRPQRD